MWAIMYAIMQAIIYTSKTWAVHILICKIFSIQLHLYDLVWIGLVWFGL